MNASADYAAFWNVEPHEAPHKTGAASVMDLADIRDVLDHFDLDMSNRRVVDVGCGTGRLAQVCGDYYGYDVAAGMVAYAKQNGVRAALIGDLEDCQGADIVCCLSVFTHIPRFERQAYLARFAQLADLVLVDILPGAEEGSIPAWYADEAGFERDLVDAGFGDFDAYARVSPDGATHRYYLARKA